MRLCLSIAYFSFFFLSVSVLKAQTTYETISTEASKGNHHSFRLWRTIEFDDDHYLNVLNNYKNGNLVAHTLQMFAKSDHMLRSSLLVNDHTIYDASTVGGQLFLLCKDNALNSFYTIPVNTSPLSLRKRITLFEGKKGSRIASNTSGAPQFFLSPDGSKVGVVKKIIDKVEKKYGFNVRIYDSKFELLKEQVISGPKNIASSSLANGLLSNEGIFTAHLLWKGEILAVQDAIDKGGYRAPTKFTNGDSPHYHDLVFDGEQVGFYSFRYNGKVKKLAVSYTKLDPLLNETSNELLFTDEGYEANLVKVKTMKRLADGRSLVLLEETSSIQGSTAFRKIFIYIYNSSDKTFKKLIIDKEQIGSFSEGSFTYRVDDKTLTLYYNKDGKKKNNSFLKHQFNLTTGEENVEELFEATSFGCLLDVRNAYELTSGEVLLYTCNDGERIVLK